MDKNKLVSDLDDGDIATMDSIAISALEDNGDYSQMDIDAWMVLRGIKTMD